MKRFFLLIAILCSLCGSINAQQKVRSMSDGERRIYYTELEEAKTKLIEYYTERKEKEKHDYEFSLEHFPFEMFKDLVLHDERSQFFNFSFNEVDEITSEENSVKIYIWNTGQGGALRNFEYDGVFAYNCNGQYSAFSSDGYGNENHRKLVPFGLNPESIYTLSASNDVVKFYVNFSYRTYGYYEKSIAYSIIDGKLSLESLFEMEDGSYSSEIAHSFLPGWSEFPNYMDCTSQTIYRPVMYQPAESEGYCLPYSSGRVQQWKYDGSKFRYKGIAYVGDETVHPKLRNYAANVVTLHMKPWVIRVDLMTNGAYRYSSWKNKDISQEPDLIINSGYRTNPIEGTKGFKSFMNEYVFQNNEYFYILSYEMVIYNGRYECSSPQLVVKKNDKVLMTVVPQE